MIYDVIIVWWWAAWLFASINMPKNLNKIILEKNPKPWVKVLLSWGERCNVSNIDIDPERDYFSLNKQVVKSLLSKFSNYDMIDWLEKNWVQTQIEDRWRIILKSWDSKQLLELLIKKANSNWTKIYSWIDVLDINIKEINWENIFDLKTNKWSYATKNVIISTWGRSFYQVWTDWWWYRIAEKFWIKLVEPYKALCGITTRKNLSDLSWSTLKLTLEIFDKDKMIYHENWSFLFTHWWISWPITFNAIIRTWEYLREKWINQDKEELYIRENIKAKLTFDIETITKKVKWFFNINKENLSIILDIQEFRSWKEAKATGWWINTKELKNNFESKKIPGLYFIGEVLDITGKTWWFNLQQAWSSWFICWNSFK